MKTRIARLGTALLIGGALVATTVPAGASAFGGDDAPSVAPAADCGGSDYPLTTCTTVAQPTISVELVAPLCEHDTPYLVYRVKVTGTSATTVTITFRGAGGEEFVYTNQPLSGRVLWPGAVVSGGATIDWPGWTQNSDGSWTEGDEWSWARAPLTVYFQVNPEASASVTYPPASPLCAPGPRVEGGGGQTPSFVLPETL